MTSRLQAKRFKMQIWAQDARQTFVIVMARRDAAGKRDTIKGFMEHLNPDTPRVCALGPA